MPIPLRLGSVSTIAGAVILVAATVLHPLGADPGDPIAAFTEYAADHAWVVTHLGQFLGIALMFVGLVALSDSLSEEPTAWLARLGVYVGAAALGATAVLQAVDGIALKVMVDYSAKSGPRSWNYSTRPSGSSRRAWEIWARRSDMPSSD